VGINAQAKWSGALQRVGYARAFLWESGAMTDLNIGTRGQFGFGPM